MEEPQNLDGVSIPKRVSEALKLDGTTAVLLGDNVSIPKRVSEALKLPHTADSGKIDGDVSIPKRVSEALKPGSVEASILCQEAQVSIPKRVSEALKLYHIFELHRGTPGFNP